MVRGFMGPKILPLLAALPLLGGCILVAPDEVEIWPFGPAQSHADPVKARADARARGQCLEGPMQVIGVKGIGTIDAKDAKGDEYLLTVQNCGLTKDGSVTLVPRRADACWNNDYDAVFTWAPGETRTCPVTTEARVPARSR